MIKHIILLAFIFLGIPVLSEEIPITITPIKKIATTNDSLEVGDIVEFRDVNSNEIIVGTIREIQNNGIAGVQAALLINNFKYKNSGEVLSGELYVKGSEHEKYQEFSNYFGASAWVRGGEVILIPNKTQLTVFLNKQCGKAESAIQLRPEHKISTCYNEIEPGDKIRFVVTNDVYKNGKIFIKKGSPLVGIVEYLNENGWCYDNAEIELKTFRVRDVNGNIVTINNDVLINGFEVIKYKRNKFAQFFNYCGVIFRGKEIEILKDDNYVLTLWY